MLQVFNRHGRAFLRPDVLNDHIVIMIKHRRCERGKIIIAGNAFAGRHEDELGKDFCIAYNVSAFNGDNSAFQIKNNL